MMIFIKTQLTYRFISDTISEMLNSRLNAHSHHLYFHHTIIPYFFNI